MNRRCQTASDHIFELHPNVKNHHITIKIDRLRLQQYFFIKYVVLSETWCIANLDFKSGPEYKTLHDFLMALRVSNLPDQPFY